MLANLLQWVLLYYVNDVNKNIDILFS